ncbi:hypothetical protein Glove_258g52 [Diversispora epigaea]|uniref:Uncharacterized protein n=1 Tax=Diversispora epigaea TaxID=1348612 RepID=A0A397I9C9_9GLOM|nr:hypothetical protein Glove_258g52 [Diversispora epigaea]
MNPKVLQKSLGVGNDCHLLERVWNGVLPCINASSSYVGAVFGSDFYNWAIKLLQDRGKNINKDFKRWSIFDMRNNKKKPLEQKGKDVIYVFCNENFESVQLIYSDGTKDYVQLLGEEENLLGYDILKFLDNST